MLNIKGCGFALMSNVLCNPYVEVRNPRTFMKGNGAHFEHYELTLALVASPSTSSGCDSCFSGVMDTRWKKSFLTG